MLKASVCWATGKRLTNRLSNLSLTTLSPPETAGYSGPDRMYGSTCHPLVVPIYGGPGRVFIRLFTLGDSLFFKKRFHGGHEIRTHEQRLKPFRRRHMLRHWSVGATGETVNQSPTQTKPYNSCQRARSSQLYASLMRKIKVRFDLLWPSNRPLHRGTDWCIFIPLNAQL